MVIVGAGRSLELPRSRGFVQQGVAADNRHGRPSASLWRLPQNADTLGSQLRPMLQDRGKTQDDLTVS
jgi:hypothetical protein